MAIYPASFMFLLPGYHIRIRRYITQTPPERQWASYRICFVKGLLMLTARKSPRVCCTGSLCKGDPPITDKFPSHPWIPLTKDQECRNCYHAITYLKDWYCSNSSSDRKHAMTCLFVCIYKQIKWQSDQLNKRAGFLTKMICIANYLRNHFAPSGADFIVVTRVDYMHAYYRKYYRNHDTFCVFVLYVCY